MRDVIFLTTACEFRIGDLVMISRNPRTVHINITPDDITEIQHILKILEIKNYVYKPTGEPTWAKINGKIKFNDYKGLIKLA